MKKSQGTFRVVDVGGSYFGWSAPYVDAIIDFNNHTGSSTITHFKCDITHPCSWEPILEYVSRMGKFDFCICTHTLEDIMNPVFVCEQMSAIAHAGYIAFPSKCRELARIEGNYSGAYPSSMDFYHKKQYSNWISQNRVFRKLSSI